MAVQYLVCNRLLDPETNEHCEFDGDVDVQDDRSTLCPGCRGVLVYRSPKRYLCPECVQGKPWNCIGWTLDENDAETPCTTTNGDQT